MIAHIVIGFVLLVVSSMLLGIAFKHYGDYWFGIGIFSMIGICASVVILLWAPFTVLEYNQFEVKYEIQQEMFTAYKENIPEVAGNITYIADIVEINAEIADYQASKQYWDWWSCLPDRVMDLEPIGLGG